MRKVEWHTVQAALDAIGDVSGAGPLPVVVAVLVPAAAADFTRRRWAAVRHPEFCSTDELDGESLAPRPRYLH